MSVISSLFNAATSTFSAVSATNQTQQTSDTDQTVDTSSTSDQGVAKDPVTFSAAAVQKSAATTGNTPFFPTRSGMSADALVAGVANPGAVTSSAGKSFPDVATDARQRMDDKYAQMTASGKPYDPNSPDSQDTYSLLGDLDRRSLYAVSSNQGGQFTKAEQDAASSMMKQQLSLAMGVYSGPASKESQYVSPFGAGNLTAQVNAGISFMNNVSNEEKHTQAWVTQRMAMQGALTEAPTQKPVAMPTLFEVLADTSDDDSSNIFPAPPATPTSNSNPITDVLNGTAKPPASNVLPTTK